MIGALALADGALTRPAAAQPSVRAWGPRVYDSRWSEPDPGNPVLQLAAGSATLVLRANGSIVGFGDGVSCNVAALPPGTTYTAVASGDAYGLAIRSDGTGVGWGGTTGLSSTQSSLGPLPVSLAPFGLAGCTFDDAVTLLLGAATDAAFRLPIPRVAAFRGLVLFQRALVLDPAAPNGAGLVVSDAMRLQVGG